MASKPKASNGPTTSTGLKDLSNELLFNIFKHLAINDLVNIVEYNDYFKPVVHSVFEKKFYKDGVTVTNEFQPYTEISSTSVKLLNLFGNNIMKLVVNYNEAYRELNHIINDTVISLCHKTLEEVVFINAGQFTMFKSPEKFVNVHTVTFETGQHCEMVFQFGELFPKAHTLKLNWQNLGEYCTHSNMKTNPSLKHLEIGIFDRYTATYSFELINTLVEMSPGLKTLHIEIGHSDSERKRDNSYRYSDESGSEICIDANMPNLKCLSLIFQKDINIYGSIIGNAEQRRFFKELTNLTIEYSNLNFKELPIKTETLRTLTLCSSHGFTKNCVLLFNDNKNVEVVELIGPCIDDATDVIASFSKLHNLKSITFPFPYIYGTDRELVLIQVMLKDCKQLVKVIVTAKDVKRKEIPGVVTSMNALGAAVDMQWQSSVRKEVIPLMYMGWGRITYHLLLEKKQLNTQVAPLESETKRQRSISDQVSNLHKKQKVMEKQLDDLNEYCLIEIFKYLTIDDLVNIVQFNNNFNIAALVAFKWKYGNKVIEVSVEYNSMTKEPLWCIELLKFFGSATTKLRVKYYEDDSHQIDDAIDNAIMTYCQESLIEIEILHGKRYTMNGIDKPFKNVEVVSFVGGIVSEIVYGFGKWFPKAHTLKFKDAVQPKYFSNMEMKNAPALLHFETRIRYYERDDIISRQIIKTNPQLTTLHNGYFFACDRYNDNMEVDDEELMDQPMPNVKMLYMTLLNERRRGERDIGYDENKIYHFEALKHLHIEFKDSAILNNLTISAANLQSLILIGHETVSGSNCLSLIRDNENLKSIKIIGTRMQDSNSLCELCYDLNNLNELEFSYNGQFYEYYDGIQFDIDVLLERCKLLRKLVVYCGSNVLRQNIEDEFNAADAAIKIKWTISRGCDINSYNSYDFMKTNCYSLTFEKIC